MNCWKNNGVCSPIIILISCTIFLINFHCRFFLHRPSVHVVNQLFFFFLYKSSMNGFASINAAINFTKLAVVTKWPWQNFHLTSNSIRASRDKKHIELEAWNERELQRSGPPPSRNGKAKSVAWKRVSHPGSVHCIYRILV